MTPENKTDIKRNKSSQEIEAELSETRTALTDDVKALGDKVSPAHIKQQAKNALEDAKDAAVDKMIEVKDAALDLKDVAVEKVIEVKEATVEKAQQATAVVAETMDDVGDQARRAGKVAWTFTVDNAVPLSLLGVGTGWLIANQRRQRTRRAALPAHTSGASQRADLGYVASPAESVAYSSDPYPGNGPSNRRGSSTMLDQSKKKLVASASRGRDVVQQKVVRAGRASRDFAEANPLAVVLGTLAVGVGVGLLLPSTARENQLLAPSREKFKRVIDEARDAARDVGSVAKETAKDTIATVEASAH